MGELGGRVHLRPIGGGKEWEAVPETEKAPSTREGTECPPGRQEQQQSVWAVKRVIGRYAGVLFIIMISGSCGLVIGMALALDP